MIIKRKCSFLFSCSLPEAKEAPNQIEKTKDPLKGYEDGEGTGTSLLRGEAEGAGLV